MKIHIATFFKIPLFIHWSWFLLIPFVIFLNEEIEAGLLIMLMAFLFVTLHEYGHCLMANVFNLTVRDVTLYPIGGVARLYFPPGGAKEEFFIALAGPFVNFVFAIIFICACFFVPAPAEFVSLTDLLKNYPLFFISSFGFFINVFMICFNMLPVIPMDGGRVLRACLTMILDYQLATLIAVRLAQMLCICLIFFGFYYKNLLIIVVFLLMFLASQNELMLANHYTNIYVMKQKVARALGRPELVNAELSEVIAALEDVEDEKIKELLQTRELIPLLRDIESQKS